MPTELINILVQLPLVAAFVWYSIVTNRQFQDFLREEREARGKQMDGIVQELKALGARLNEHDKQAAREFAQLRGPSSDERQSSAPRGREW